MCSVWLLLNSSIDAYRVQGIGWTVIFLGTRSCPGLQRVDIVLVSIVVVIGHHQTLLRIVEGSACCVLRFDHFEKIAPLGRRDALFELRRGHQALGIRDYLIRRLIVLAGRDEGAFGAAPLDKQLSLQVDCGFLELVEAFELEPLPDLLLRQMGTLFNDLTLFLVQPVVEARAGGLVMVSKWLLGPLKPTLAPCQVVLVILLD